MTRVRAKVARNLTDDSAWARRRDDVLSRHRGEAILECSEFWRNEPGVPKALREDPLRWTDLLAPPDLAKDIRARRATMLAKRRAWFTKHVR